MPAKTENCLKLKFLLMLSDLVKVGFNMLCFYKIKFKFSYLAADLHLKKCLTKPPLSPYMGALVSDDRIEHLIQNRRPY